MILKTTGKPLNATFLNPTTQRAKDIIMKYEAYPSRTTIFKAYGRPSNRKIEAYNQIVQEMQSVHGSGMRITGAGSDIFSCAYTVDTPDCETYLIYHTPGNRYAIKLD